MDEPPKSPERRRVEHLANEYLMPNVYEYRAGGRHPFDDSFYEFHQALHHLRRANEVLEFLKTTGRDPYTTFNAIASVLSDARAGVAGAKQVLAGTGFLEMLDDHLHTVMSGLDPDGLPPEESAVLEQLGFPALAAVVHAEVDLIAAEWQAGTAAGIDVGREQRRRPVTAAFDESIQRIEEHRIDLEPRKGPDETLPDNAPETRRGRRWWKGIGQIVEGSAIAVADAGLAVGAFTFPVSPAVQTYGAVVSVAGGVGKIMNGVGDLRSE